MHHLLRVQPLQAMDHATNMKTMRALLTLMILLSLFAGLPINGVWNLLYDFEFIAAPETIFIYHNWPESSLILWVILLALHLIIFALPFLSKSKYFIFILTLAPLLFFIVYFFLDGFTALFLIPFLIVWLICVFKQNRLEQLAKKR